ncbi:NAD(P)-binding protein [Hymenopellis radicata]|nr:NAD(P)-binding protein [Hymenopellis radicata]
MGNAVAIFKESFPPSPKYAPSKDMPDLTGKVVIVTGANTGVGYETVKALLEHNAKVYLAARSQDKALAAIEKLKSETGGKEAIFLRLDLASLADIKRSAEEFKSKEDQLHILINNAGIMRPPLSDLTKDGYDMQFGTNVLGHFYFTTLLLPVLEKAARAEPPDAKGDVRVVNVSSAGIYSWTKNDLAWDSFRDGPGRKKLSSMDLYVQSKVGNVLFSQELARRFGDKGIVSSSLNPGNLASDLYRNQVVGRLRFIASLVFLYKVSYGALTPLWAATSLEGRNFNGAHLIPWARVGKATPLCENPDVAKALWEWCEEQVSGV